MGNTGKDVSELTGGTDKHRIYHQIIRFFSPGAIGIRLRDTSVQPYSEQQDSSAIQRKQVRSNGLKKYKENQASTGLLRM